MKIQITRSQVRVKYILNGNVIRGKVANMFKDHKLNLIFFLKRLHVIRSLNMCEGQRSNNMCEGQII